MHKNIIIILFLFVTCTWQACYSSCDTCSSYCSNCCLSCPSVTLISNFTCQPLTSVAEQIIVDDSWNSSKTPKMPFLIDSSGLIFTAAVDLGWTGTSGLQLNLGTQSSIAFKFVNISTHYQVEARFSAELSTEPGCLNSYVGLYYSNNNLSPDSYTYTYMFSMTQLAQLLNLTVNHNASSQQIKLQFSGDAMNVCSYLILRDATFLIYLCSPVCLTCSSYNLCTSCGVDSFGQNLYMDIVQQTCTLFCSLNYYMDFVNNLYICDQCDIACFNCMIPSSSNDCLSCNNAIGYNLAYGSTTKCIFGCPIGQFVTGTPLTCQNCSTNCRTCSGNLKTCTSCGLNAGVQQYLNTSSNICVYPCALNYLSQGNLSNFVCDKCHKACLICSVANDSTNCVSCQESLGYNLAAGTNTTCVQGCPVGQFLGAGVPLTCKLCKTMCLTCKIIQTNCTSCLTPLFLTASATCLSSCPSHFYPNTTDQSCHKCNETCLQCWGILSSECYNCTNVTLTGITTIYYLSYGGSTCAKSCPSGQYIDKSFQNQCQPCSTSCSQCSISSTNCTGTCPNSNFFFNNSCYSTCPTGTFVSATNSSDHTCYLCNYYFFDGACLQQCPSGYTGVISNISTCTLCTDSNCNSDSNSFTVSIKVVNQGNNYQHIVYLPQGISDTCTQQSLLDGLSVELFIGEARLLLTTVSLTVQGLTISSNNQQIIILTNYYPAYIWSSTLSVSFRAGALVSSSGVSYSQLTSTISLSSPIFVQSYFSTFSKGSKIQAEGIVFVILSFLLAMGAIFWIKNSKLIHECMSFVFMVQVFGLTKIRKFPFDFDFYNSLLGFSSYELSWIPNKFSNIFSKGSYTQVAIDPAVFVYGAQNFIIAFGSIFYIYLPLQLMIFIFYLIYRDDEPVLSFIKTVQQNLLMLWSNIVLFGCVLCLLSISNNQIVSSNLYYAFTMLICFSIVTAFAFYYVKAVKDNLQLQLYKINNLVRVVGVLLLAYGYNEAILFFNFSEIFFIAIDFTFYKIHKYSVPLFFIERIIYIFVLNCSLLQIEYQVLLVLAGVCFGVIAFIKFYHFVKTAVTYLEEKEKERIKGELSVSGDLSVASKQLGKDLHETAEYHLKGQPLGQSSLQTKPNKLISASTLVEPLSIVFNEKQVNNINSYQSFDEIMPNMDEKEEEMAEEIKRVAKRRRHRMEPVVVRHEAHASNVEVIEIEANTQQKKSDVEKRSSAESQIWI